MAGTRSGAFDRQCPKQCRTRRGADRRLQGAFARLPGPGSVRNGKRHRYTGRQPRRAAFRRAAGENGACTDAVPCKAADRSG